MATASRHSTPLLIGENGIQPLSRIEFGKSSLDGGLREAFLQDLVHRFPNVIPMQDIEPAFMPMIPIYTELPMKSGYLDNLWLTAEGGIIVGECKLARNTQAWREVLVQALDYAQALTTWSFDDLQAGVWKAVRSTDTTLWQMVQRDVEPAQQEEGEAQFTDSIQRRLRSGRFVVLIVMDGVQEGLESLTSYLQLHAGLHASIALVELSIWKSQGDELLVVPRIPLRTVLVERGIVTVAAGGQVSIVPPAASALASVSRVPQPFTASETEFYERLDSQFPGSSYRLKAFLATLRDLGIEPEFRKSAILRWYPSPDLQASAGYIGPRGLVWLGDALLSAAKLGKPQAGMQYLQEIALAVGGSVKSYASPNSPPQVLDADGQVVRVPTLLNRADAWSGALSRLIEATQVADAE